MDLGVDSLMAVELRNHLSKGLKLQRPLSATLAFDHPTSDAIAKHLARDILGLETATPSETESGAAAEAAAAASAAARIEGLSDEQVEAMLMKKLEEI